MARLLLPILITLGAIGLAFGLLALAGVVLQQIGEGLRSAFNSAMRRAALASQRADQKRLENKQKREEVVRRTEEGQISQFRHQHPAQIVGVPDLAALNGAVTALNDFVAKAEAYRRQKFTPSFDTKFRSVTFSFPFEFFFPRDCEGSSDGPDPDPWETTLDSLVVPRGRDLRSVYKSVISMQDFPSHPQSHLILLRHRSIHK
jgi:hypothetical protein